MGVWLERYRQAVKGRDDRPEGHLLRRGEAPREPEAALLVSRVPLNSSHREALSLAVGPVPPTNDVVESVPAPRTDGRTAADRLRPVPAGSVIASRGEDGKLQKGIVRAVAQDSRLRRLVLADDPRGPRVASRVRRSHQ